MLQGPAAADLRDRAGHCAFTPAETITAVKALLGRLVIGKWSFASLTPAALNRHAAALGPSYNIFQVNGQIVPAPPSFLSYRPAPFLRPFDAGSPVPH